MFIIKLHWFQGISNMNALAEQIKSLQPSTFTTKVVSPVAPKPSTNVPIAVRMVGGGTLNSGGMVTIGSNATTTLATTTQTTVAQQERSVISLNTSGPLVQSLSTSSGVVLTNIITSRATSNADTLSISQSVSDSFPSETLPAITMESDEIDSKEHIHLAEGNFN